ncbi:MAG: type II/IV secretion system ATPase subunit, partial [Candidatus Nanohaloarchaea archaeon]|nr:type II/IV secretion system ATPase subunit [Candidatus Nanohaloarchaea archaeon]
MSIDFAKLAKKIQKAKEKREEEEKQKWKDRMPDKIEVKAEGNITAENAQVESQQVQNQNVSEQQTGEQTTGGQEEGQSAGQQEAGRAARQEMSPPTEQNRQPQETHQERTAVQQGGGSGADTVSLNPDLGGAADWLEESEEEEDEDETNKEEINQQYPLLPEDADSVQQAHAWAEITYDPAQEELVYRLHEPDLNDRLQEVLDRVEELLKERLDVDFAQLKKEEAKDYLREQVKKILDGHSFNLSQQDRSIIQYYAFRNFVGLDRIEPLMADTEIEDISCDGVNIPIYVYHRDPDIGSVKTNVVFEDDDELDAFVRKLAQRCGRSISIAEPLLDGSLPDGSRVQATLGTDIARRGTNFTIRRFTEEPLTPIHLMEYGSINAEMLAYLWMAVE